MNLLSLSPNAVDALTYVDDQNAMVEVPEYATEILNAINIFMQYKHSIRETITNVEWKLLTKKTNDFLVSSAYIVAHSGVVLPTSTTSAPG